MSDGVAGSQIDRPVLLFDGVCRFCNGFVNFAIRRDPTAQFLFAPLQSETGRRLLARCGLPDDLSTFVYVAPDRCYDRSTAILKVVRRLTGLWPMFYFLIVIPRPIRDAIYRCVATNRYRFLGKDDHCLVPTPDVRSRFLD